MSSILTNSEVWYGLSKSELEELEVLDRSLLKRKFSCPNSTPTAALYLESGCVRVSTIVKARRVNYLQYLLKLPKHEMLSKFFYCQWLDKKPHDWTEQVKNDLKDFNLTADLELIGKKSVFSRKNLVKKKFKEFEFKSLTELSTGLLNELDVHEAKTVFKFRVRMAQFSGNFKGQGPPDLCPPSALHPDLQEECLQCPVVRGKIEIDMQYENIFVSVITRNVARTLQAITKLRRKDK